MKAVVCQPHAEAQMLLEVRLKLGTGRLSHTA